MLFRTVRWISLVCTAVTLGALTAHVLELPNKFRLDGLLWLTVQQNLYRGWGLFIGPFEVTAVRATWILLYLGRKDRTAFRLTLLAACPLSGALAGFFILNAPVNAAFASWTPTTLPPTGRTIAYAGRLATRLASSWFWLHLSYCYVRFFSTGFVVRHDGKMPNKANSADAKSRAAD